MTETSPAPERTNAARIACAVIIALVALHVAIAPLVMRDGFLTPDSTGYLALAQNLLAGRGYTLLELQHTGTYAHFSAQPPLYAAGIAVAGAMLPRTPDGIFAASKIFNVLCAAATMVLLARAMPGRGWRAALLLLAMPFLHLFTFTWSEALFIPLLVGFAVALDRLLADGRPSLVMILCAAACAAALAATRYIGAFALLLPAFAAVRLLSRDFRRAAPLLFVASAGALTVALLAWWNHRAGSVAGLRAATTEPFAVLARETLVNLALAANVMVREGGTWKRIALALATGLIELAALVHVWRAVRREKHAGVITTTLPRTLAMLGALYLACIIPLRFVIHFDALNYRLLGPGVFCLFAALVLRAEVAFGPAALALFRRWTLVITGIGFLTGAPLYLFDNAGPSYASERARILRDHEAVPPGTIVAFGSMHLRYLRPDLDAVVPRDPPYAERAPTMEEFLDVLKKSPASGVVVAVRPPEEMTTADRAEFMRRHAGEGRVRVR